MRFHSLTVPGLALAVGFVCAGTAPHFAPADATTLQKTIETETHLKTTSVSIEFDGEEQSGDEDGDASFGFDDTGKYVVTDVYVKSAKGRPLHLERTFDELTGTTVQTWKGGEEESETKKEQESELASKTVVFKWDDKKEEYAPSFQDDKGDSALLADLDEDLDFRAFLPEGDVKGDATWSVDGALAKIFLFPGGDLKMKSKDDEDKDDGKMDRDLREHIKGKFVATYKGTREEGDKKYAVIELKGDLKTNGETDSEEEGKIELSLEYVLTGEILWDTAGNHVHSVTIQGDESANYSMSVEVDMEDQHHSFKQTLVMSGTTKYSLKVGK